MPFLPETEFRMRAKALMDALGDASCRREEVAAREAAWEAEQGAGSAGSAKAAHCQTKGAERHCHAPKRTAPKGTANRTL